LRSFTLLPITSEAKARFDLVEEMLVKAHGV